MVQRSVLIRSLEDLIGCQNCKQKAQRDQLLQMMSNKNVNKLCGSPPDHAEATPEVLCCHSQVVHVDYEDAHQLHKGGTC